MGSRSTRLPLNINSIKVMETSSNLESVISAITALDILISDNDPPPTYNHGKTLSSLFNYLLNEKLDKKFNKYIYNTFKLFTASKQEIYIDLYELDDYNKNDDGKLVHLLVHELKAFDIFEEHEFRTDNVNLLRPQLFSIFPNIKYISIWPSNYIFSLSAFLSLIE